MTPATQTRIHGGLGGWLRRHRGLGEFGVVAGCLLIYFLIRGNVVNRPASAFAHAADIISLEKRLGVFWEPDWQNDIRASLAQKTFWNDVYFWLHAPIIALIAFWLYFRRRRVYTLMRNAFLFSALIGLFLYATYPVAPPRLMTPSGYQEYGVQPAATPQYGFHDTMREYANLDYQAESLKPFVNPFAAVPSLHFGWAFLIALGVLLALRNWLGWAAVIGLPVLMFFGVVLTANHFIFDAAIGLAAVLAGLAGAFALARLPVALHRRFVPALIGEFLGLQGESDAAEPALQ
jgi:PAP2 superfamily